MSATGEVFAIAQTAVYPPRAAAREPESTVSASSRPARADACAGRPDPATRSDRRRRRSARPRPTSPRPMSATTPSRRTKSVGSPPSGRTPLMTTFTSAPRAYLMSISRSRASDWSVWIFPSSRDSSRRLALFLHFVSLLALTAIFIVVASRRSCSRSRCRSRSRDSFSFSRCSRSLVREPSLLASPQQMKTHTFKHMNARMDQSRECNRCLWYPRGDKFKYNDSSTYVAEAVTRLWSRCAVRESRAGMSARASRAGRGWTLAGIFIIALCSFERLTAEEPRDVV